MFDRMLVPTDGSDLSTQAALRAVALAKTCGAHVTVLLVQDVYPYTGIGSVNADDLQAYVAKARAEGLSAMDPVAQAAREEGVPVETLVVENDKPAYGIVEAAQRSGAKLIAMGSHGRGGIARLILGSVAAEVLALSPVPVLVFK
jgi:nucleotide-binding universal stress UspA family protein